MAPHGLSQGRLSKVAFCKWDGVVSACDNIATHGFRLVKCHFLIQNLHGRERLFNLVFSNAMKDLNVELFAFSNAMKDMNVELFAWLALREC